MAASPENVVAAFAAALPAGTVVGDRAAFAHRLVDWRGQIRGDADAMLRPSTTGEVAAIVRIAAQHGAALVPQGGNTGLVGGGIPAASGRPTMLLVMDRMARIRATDGEGLTLIAEAGAILSDIEDAAARMGAHFPLSLASKGSATIGGLVSTNAGGVQVLRHGTMRSLVLGLEAVLPDGQILDQLAPLRKDNTGYDIKQLLIGAEGTLGVVTAAALRLAPRPEVMTTLWVGLVSAGAALQLLRRMRRMLGETVESFELIQETALDLVVERLSAMRRPLAGRHGFHVLIDVAVPAAAAERALAAAHDAGEVEDAVIAASIAQARALWNLREGVPEAERIEGPAVKNDIAVPVAAVPAFLDAALAMFAARFPGSRPIAFGHLGDGNLHLNLRPPTGVDAVQWLDSWQTVARREIHDLVVRHAGSISAEHGIGTLKAAELARLGDPGKLAAMRAIKAALDPANILNPGKIFI